MPGASDKLLLAQNGSWDAAFSVTSINGCTAKKVTTVTAMQTTTDAERSAYRGGEPPAGASWSSAGIRMYMARMTAR